MRRWMTVTATTIVLALVVTACGGDDDSGDTGDSGGDPSGETATTTTTVPEGAAYREPGPHPVGVQTFVLADGTTQVDVWYPSTAAATDGMTPVAYSLADWLPEALRAQVPEGVAEFETTAYAGAAPSTEGPFPLVLFSHGFASYRDQSTFLTTHLASWGMVVVAPDHPSRGLTSILTGGEPDQDAALNDIRGARTLVWDSVAAAGGPLSGMVDPERVAIVGHSAGGGTALAVANDPTLGGDIDMYVSLASGAFQDGTELPDIPSVFMAGSDDDIVEPERTRDAFDRAAEPSTLYEFAGAGHLAFADICEIGKGDGGVLGLAERFGIAVPENLQVLATDGCGADETAPTAVWPAVAHFTTAQLRAVWGIDEEPVGLEATTDFPELDITVTTKP